MFAHLIGMLREGTKCFVERCGKPLMQGLGVICIGFIGVMRDRFQPLADLFGIT